MSRVDEREGPVGVSVVTATHNRAALVERLVGALDAQDLDEPFEAVVVDDGSTDDTWTVLEQLAAGRPWLRPVRLADNAGPAHARNVGWRAARGEVVAFVDDDCVPSPQWLRLLAPAARDHGLAQGRVEPNPEQWERRGPFSRTLVVDGPKYFQTANIAYRRDVLERTGGFDERYRFAAGEDTELGYRARDLGFEPAWVADALVHHDVSPSDFRAHLRSLRRWQYVPLVISQRPEARALMHSRYWWKATHPPTVQAVAGLAVLAAAAARRSPLLAAAGAALGVPYARTRVLHQPAGRSLPETLRSLPGRFALDVAEVAYVLKGSARFKALVL